MRAIAARSVIRKNEKVNTSEKDSIAARTEREREK